MLLTWSYPNKIKLTELHYITLMELSYLNEIMFYKELLHNSNENKST